jgi:hypothetical protein
MPVVGEVDLVQPHAAQDMLWQLLSLLCLQPVWPWLSCKHSVKGSLFLFSFFFETNQALTFQPEAQENYVVPE